MTAAESALTSALPSELAPGAVLTKAVQNHLIQAISQAPFLGVPFPALQQAGAFPADFYRAMGAHFPDLGQFSNSQDRRTSNGYSLEYRRRITLSSPKAARQLSARERLFWQQLVDFFASRRFLTAMVQKYYPHLQRRYPNEDFKLVTRLELICDLTHYRIKPHTDATHKMLTTLFYLPEDDAHPELGTSAYVPKKTGFTNEAGVQMAYELFNECYRAPFLPNSFFSFMKTERSFHGREPIEQEGVERKMMILSIQHAKTSVLS